MPATNGLQSITYKRLLQFFLAGKISKQQFETNLKTILSPEEIQEHNHYILAILVRAANKPPVIPGDQSTLFKIKRSKIAQERIEKEERENQKSKDKDSQVENSNEKGNENSKRRSLRVSIANEKREDQEFELSNNDGIDKAMKDMKRKSPSENMENPVQKKIKLDPTESETLIIKSRENSGSRSRKK